MVTPLGKQDKNAHKEESGQIDMKCFPCRFGKIKRISQPGFRYYYCHIDQFDVIYGRLIGSGTLDDMLPIFKNAQTDPSRKPETRVICDFRGAKVDSNFSAMFNYVKQLNLHANMHNCQSQLLIILTGNPASFGKGRMFESLSSANYKEIMVVMDLSAAADKLGVGLDLFNSLVSEINLLEAEIC
jgi:hypothetical protein